LRGFASFPESEDDEAGSVLACSGNDREDVVLAFLYVFDFVAVNCAAFTETLLESELFGHEKGAIIGADRQRQGLFEAANEGTLFLDEAGEMSLAAQAKLLRVLTDGQVLRVGSTRPRRVDVRVVVATHRNLEQRVKEGLFREDLFYRLAVVPIHLPPLRDRRDDIPGLSDVFCHQVATELKMPRRRLTSAALEKLQQYRFPGNLRELRNLIERAYILTSDPEIGLMTCRSRRMKWRRRATVARMFPA